MTHRSHVARPGRRRARGGASEQQVPSVGSVGLARLPFGRFRSFRSRSVRRRGVRLRCARARGRPPGARDSARHGDGAARSRLWNPRPARRRRFRPYSPTAVTETRKACARSCSRDGMSYDRYYRVNRDREPDGASAAGRRQARGRDSPTAVVGNPRPSRTPTPAPAPGGSGGRPAPVLRTGTMPHPCA